jgi:AraC-like DNA-binding protein
MSVYRHIPAAPLDRYVDFFWYYIDLIPDHNREHVLPDGTFELIINLQEKSRKLFHRGDSTKHVAFKRGWISGAHSKFLVIDAVPRSSMIGVHFKPGGAAAFLGLPADELAEQVTELDAVWGWTVWSWRDQLLAADTVALKFAILERLLNWRLVQNKLPPRQSDAIAWAVARYMGEPSLQTIISVSRHVGFSHKHFIELFRRQTGLSPKLFCRIRRFQKVLLEVHTRGKVNWADVAYSCGYFDQSHFIHDFVNFSGVNPSTYLGSFLEGEPNFVRAA